VLCGNMRKLIPPAFAAALCLALASCVTDSVNPLCSPDAAKPDPRLLGIWYDAKDRQTTVFTQEKGPWVHIVSTNLDDDPGKPDMVGHSADNYDAFPTVIGTNTFLNVRVPQTSVDVGKKKPTYYLVRYTISNDGILQMAMIPPDVSAKLVRDGRIKGEVRESNTGGSKDTDVTFNDSSENLMKLIQASDVSQLFTQSMNPLQREKPAGF